MTKPDVTYSRVLVRLQPTTFHVNKSGLFFTEKFMLVTVVSGTKFVIFWISDCVCSNRYVTGVSENLQCKIFFLQDAKSLWHCD